MIPQSDFRIHNLYVLMLRPLTLALLVVQSRAISPLSKEAQGRRTLGRFTRGHAENSLCWERNGRDGIVSVIDAHQHPMPFGGPEVPFSTYTDWFIQHGIVFSVFMGIGQRIVKQNASDPDCCYYLHCPTYGYPIIPMPESDVLNAEERLKHYTGKVDKKLHLILSATFPNLQRNAGAKEKLLQLWGKFPHTFTWMGEINVFKHALAANGFFSDFTGPRLTVARVEAGELDDMFSLLGPEQPNGEHIPTVTIHSDMGCDAYSFPAGSGDGVHPMVCEAPEEVKLQAQKDHLWWKATLGAFYPGFFDSENYPKHNFRKIQHIHVTHSMIARYKEVKFVWAHLGLAVELSTLHPAVHAQILSTFYERHATNLWSDLSWDVLAKLNFLNYDGQPIESHWSSDASEDLVDDALFDMAAVGDARARLDAIWQSKKHSISSTYTTLTGPSFKMAVLISLLHKYPERAITGTDYVASFGTHDQFPGYNPLNGAPLSPEAGCHKTEQTHAEQLTDTSSLNMFFDDETFAAVVLGGNFFKVAGISTTFAPPPICRDDALGGSFSSTVSTFSTPSSTFIHSATAQPPQGAFTPVAAAFLAVFGVAGFSYFAGVKRGQTFAVHLAGGSAPLLQAADES